jgi:hypothetical protein
MLSKIVLLEIKRIDMIKSGILPSVDSLNRIAQGKQSN